MSRLQTQESLDGRFSNQYKAEKIGGGGSGEVYKVVDNTDNRIYAIKKILVKGSQDDKDALKAFEREVNTLSNITLNCEYVVRIYDNWIEFNDFAYIQMEFCSNDLNSLLENKAKYFGRIENKMNLFEYFISFELLRELTECLNYLHSQKPPIMHRDLKPANVLITNGINGRFLKLCDFGLSIYHERSSMSHSSNTGTLTFIAPEVIRSRKYNLKADIYSLGMIATKLFETDFKYELNQNENEKISRILKTISEITSNMRSEIIEERPKCPEILEQFVNINFPQNLIEGYTKTFELKDGNNSDNFFYKYYLARIQN